MLKVHIGKGISKDGCSVDLRRAELLNTQIQQLKRQVMLLSTNIQKREEFLLEISSELTKMKTDLSTGKTIVRNTEQHGLVIIFRQLNRFRIGLDGLKATYTGFQNKAQVETLLISPVINIQIQFERLSTS
jgi:hypothetical protein